MPPKKARKNYKREEREHMIIMQLAIAIQNGREKWATPYQIAERIGMTNCPSFRAILDNLCQQGELQSRSIHKPGRWEGKEYTLPDGSYSEPVRNRFISINIAGRKAGQLELFD